MKPARVKSVTFRSSRLFAVLALAGCSEPAGPDPSVATGDFFLEFDGVDDYVTTGTASFPFPLEPHAISVWVRPSNLVGKQALFVMRMALDSGTEFGLLDGVPTAWRIFDGSAFVVATDPLQAGRWQHVVYSFDGLQHQLFVDGVMLGTGTLEPNNRTPITGWMGTFDGHIDFYAGALDELMVFDAALTAEQVMANRSDPEAPTELPRLGHWRFDEAEGERSFDHSDRGNHATLGEGIASRRPERVAGGPLSEP